MSLTYYFSESTFSALKKSPLERLQKCIGNSIISQHLHSTNALCCWRSEGRTEEKGLLMECVVFQDT